MESNCNYPIQLFCVVSTLGDMTPIKFRYEDPEHHLITVQIDAVHSHKEICTGGCRAILYTCSAVIEAQRTLFDLKYNISTHTWSFIRKIY